MTTRCDEWAKQRDLDRICGDFDKPLALPSLPPIAPPAGSKNLVSECLINCYKRIVLLEKHIVELKSQNSHFAWKKSVAEVLTENTAEKNKKLREQVDKLKEQIEKLNKYDKFDIMDVK